MIAQLRGTVAAVGPGEVILDVSGVGYRVRVPAGTALPRRGAQMVLHTHLSVREDAMDLYGFADPAARTLFEALLGVTGVGPKLALAALGALGTEGLRRAVVTEDVGALTVIPGVGRKGAQRMILELREKLGSMADGEAVTAVGANGDGGVRQEVRAALAALGYAPAEVHRALEVLPGDQADDVETMLRAALRGIGAQAGDNGKGGG